MRAAAPLLVALIVAITVAVLRGREADEARRRAFATDQAAELLRITDSAKAVDELRGRILQNLKLGGPYIAVIVHDTDVQVIPASTPWTVHCDPYAGISVEFISKVTDRPGGLVIQVSEARPTKEQCLEIALSTAKAVAAILAGR